MSTPTTAQAEDWFARAIAAHNAAVMGKWGASLNGLRELIDAMRPVVSASSPVRAGQEVAS